MTNLTESPIYEEGIFQLEKTTPVLGGVPVIDSGIPRDGFANVPLQQLANRTNWLKDEVSNLTGPDGSENIPYRGSDTKTALDTALNTLYQKQNKKYIYASLPLQWPGYESRLAEDGYTNTTGFIYPGCFAIDEVAREIFIVNGPSYTASAYIVVYNLDTKAYKGWFRTVSSNCEGAEILYVGGNRRFFMADKLGNLLEYNLSTTPLTGATPSLISTRALGIYNQFSYREGRWYIEENTPAIGGYITRNVLAIYNDSFLRVGTYYTGIDNSGYITKTTNAIAPFLNKRQGFAVGSGYIACAFGGSHDGTTTPGEPIEYCGVKILSTDGQKIFDSILEPVKFKALLSTSMGLGQVYNRMENEGVKILADNRVISLYVHANRSSTYRNSVGIVLMEEFSSSISAFDYSSASVPMAQFDNKNFSSPIFPRSHDGLYNPVTGVKFVGVDDICEYMRLLSVPEFGWYSGTVTLLDVDNTTPIINTSYNRIINTNGATFVWEQFGATAGAYVSWLINGTLGSRQKVAMHSGIASLKLQSDPANNTNKLNRILGGHYTNSEEPILALDIQSASAGNNLIIGGGSSAYNCSTNIRFITADTSTTVGGVEKWRIESTTGAFRPGSDNTTSIGTSSFRISQIFAGTATISTSDERFKVDIQKIDDGVLDAWATVDYTQYKFKDAVNSKGEAARFHFGVIAQRVKDVFEKTGINPFEYGILCYDSWEETPEEFETWNEVRDEQGVVVKEAGRFLTKASTPAGERYGIRYEEALVLESALMRRTTMKLEDRIKALEKDINNA